jgi:hypothetical protein
MSPKHGAVVVRAGYIIYRRGARHRLLNRPTRVNSIVMGFGYGEWSAFSLATLTRSGASPKVLVINADPFFSDKLSRPAREAPFGGGIGASG